MVEKKEGATQTCSKCRTDLICKKITSTWNNKTEEKLQWQNKSDGNPHFKFAGPGKYDCIVPDSTTITQESTVETATTPIQTDYLEDDQKNIIKHSAESLWYIRIQVEQTIKALEVNPNGGMIWEMTKIIYQELYGDKKQ